jgi:hypothetical protein
LRQARSRFVRMQDLTPDLRAALGAYVPDSVPGGAKHPFELRAAR